MCPAISGNKTKPLLPFSQGAIKLMWLRMAPEMWDLIVRCEIRWGYDERKTCSTKRNMGVSEVYRSSFKLFDVAVQRQLHQRNRTGRVLFSIRIFWKQSCVSLPFSSTHFLVLHWHKRLFFLKTVKRYPTILAPQHLHLLQVTPRVADHHLFRLRRVTTAGWEPQTNGLEGKFRGFFCGNRPWLWMSNFVVMWCYVMLWGEVMIFGNFLRGDDHFLGGSFVGCFSFWIGGCEVPLFAEIAATELSKCFLSPDVHREWHWTKYCSVCFSWNVDPISNPKAMKKVDLYYKTHEFQALFALKRFILEVATRARMQHDVLTVDVYTDDTLHVWPVT